MAALHPPEDPRNGPKIFETAALAAPGRTGANAGQVELVHRSRLLKILEHIRVLRYLAAVNAEGLLRHFFNRFFPLGRRRRSTLIRPLECLQAGSDHELQIPFGEHGIGILPVQHFSLFGDADLTGKASRRLRQDRGMRGPAAATDRSPSAMEETKFDAERLRGAMQLAMRLVKFPGAGEHATVFVGIGVAEHDLLPASPRVDE